MINEEGCSREAVSTKGRIAECVKKADSNSWSRSSNDVRLLRFSLWVPLMCFLTTIPMHDLKNIRRYIQYYPYASSAKYLLDV